MNEQHEVCDDSHEVVVRDQYDRFENLLYDALGKMYAWEFHFFVNYALERLEEMDRIGEV